MKTRNIKTAGVLLLGLLMLTAVNAQSPRQGGRGLGPCGAGEGPGYGQGQNLWENSPTGRAGQFARLDLTEEQVEEMTTLRTEHYKVMTPLRNKNAELRARERTLLSEENVDLKALNKTIDEQTALMNSMKKIQVKHRVAVKDILTDEQVMKLQQRRQFAQRDGFHRKGGRRGGGGARGAGAGPGYRGI